MYRTQTQATWQRNLVWSCAVLLGIATVCATVLWPISRLSSEQYGPQIIRAGVAAALPSVNAVSIDAGGYEPGSALALLPGFDVYIDTTEIPTFTPEQAISRGAGVLTESLFTGGTPAVQQLAEHAAFAPQLPNLFAGALPSLLASEFQTTLFAAGLADNSRITDWRSQQAAQPGQDVQPLVGVFVQLNPADIDGLSVREIGMLVVRGLVDTLISDGQDATLALLSNSAHQAAFEQAVPAAKQRTHDLFTVLLYGFQDAIHERLENARGIQSGAANAPVGGLVSEQELAALDPSERQQFVAKRLADLVYDSGVSEAARSLSESSERAELRAAEPVLKWFDRAAHEKYVRWQYITWGFMALLVVLIVANSRGLWRQTLPGRVVLVSTVPIVLLSRTVLNLPGTRSWHVLLAGVLRETILYAIYVGAGLIVLQLLVVIIGGLRPRRRRRLL